MAFREIKGDGSYDTQLSNAIEWKLIDTLFNQNSSIVIGAICSTFASIFCCLYERNVWILAWTIVFIGLAAGRLCLAQAYHRRSSSDSPTLWANRFTIGAAANALAWGIPSAVAITQPDGLLQTLIITGQSAYISGAIVRNNAIPRAAIVQSIFSSGFLIIVCFLTIEPFHVVYGLFHLLYLTGSLEIGRFLRGKTCELLMAKEQAQQAIEELAKANILLESLATTDGLTGVSNRRGFDMALAQEYDRASRQSTDLSLMLLDIDHFKALNDVFGHQAGDACLQRLASCLKVAVRSPIDTVARYGGEEFAILMPDTDPLDAAWLAERLRATVQALALSHPTSPLGVTVSIGIATSRHNAPVNPVCLIKLADEALYRAKAEGRNRVIASTAFEDGRKSVAEVAVR